MTDVRQTYRDYIAGRATLDQLQKVSEDTLRRRGLLREPLVPRGPTPPSQIEKRPRSA